MDFNEVGLIKRSDNRDLFRGASVPTDIIISDEIATSNLSTFTFTEPDDLEDKILGSCPRMPDPITHDIRTVIFEDKPNDPWFVAADVCKVLGLTNTTIALKPLDADERAKLNLGQRGLGNVNTISESGLYKLVLRSDKPQAKAFQNWVTRDVLPAIRKDKVYVQGEEALKEGKPLPQKDMDALEARLNAKFDKLAELNMKLIEQNKLLAEDVTRKEFVIEEMSDKVSVLEEDNAALEAVKSEMELSSTTTTSKPTQNVVQELVQKITKSVP